MLPEMEIESDADGPFLISPASSDRSKTASNNGQDSNPQDSVVDTEMHELSDTHSQINLGSSTLQDSTRSSEEDHFETVQQPPTKSKGNPSRGKGKMIMVGGNLVAGGGSGMGTSSRSRNESGRIPAPRHGLLANDWAVDQHDGPKGMKLLDEELIRKYGMYQKTFTLFISNRCKNTRDALRARRVLIVLNSSILGLVCNTCA